MARVVALLPDLLFGSKVQGMLAAAGHDVTVFGTPQAAVDAVAGYDLLVADLCEDTTARIELLAPAAAAAGAKVLAFYLHTDVETRRKALAAGFHLVVPRSRMAREGAALADGLLTAAQA